MESLLDAGTISRTTREGAMQLRDRRITQHFRWREFEDRHARLQVPDAARLGVRTLLVEVLEPMRREFGACHVWSGYRTAHTNVEVGGAPKSHHRYDIWPRSPAADISFERHNVHEWAVVAEELGVGGLGVYDTHLHVDQRPGRARW